MADAISAPARGGRDPEKLGVRLTFAVFIAGTVVFVAISTWEIMYAALAAPSAAPPGAGPSACGDALRAMADAADRAAAASLTAADEATAVARFREALGPTWSVEGRARAEAACGGAGPPGAEGSRRDALAAVLRFGQAQEGFVRRQVVEIAPLRRDVSAYVAR